MISLFNMFRDVPYLLPTLCCIQKNEEENHFAVSSLRDILSLRTTCRDFHLWINQEGQCRTLIKMLELDKPFLGPIDFNPENWDRFLARRFSILASWHDKPFTRSDTFRGVNFGTAFLTDAGILLFDLGAHPVTFFLLEKNPEIKTLVVPENEKGVYEPLSECSYMDLSDEYIVFNLRHNKRTHLFSRKDHQHLYTFTSKEKILQLKIDKDILYIRKLIDEENQLLSLIDLKTKGPIKDIPLKNLKHVPEYVIGATRFPTFCFGKDYIAGFGLKNNLIIFSTSQNDPKLYEINLFEDSFLDPKAPEESSLNQPNQQIIWDIKPEGEGFIVVSQKEHNVTVSKIEILNGQLIYSLLADEIRLIISKSDINKIHYCSERLFICYDLLATKDIAADQWGVGIISYDLNSKKSYSVFKLTQEEVDLPFFCHFFNKGPLFYFLTMDMREDQNPISQLVKFDYSPTKANKASKLLQTSQPFDQAFFKHPIKQ